MSAYVEPRAHINLLVTAAIEGPHGTTGGGPGNAWSLYWYHAGESHVATRDSADDIGRMLWAENVRSVHHRYPDDDEQTGLPGSYLPDGTGEWTIGFRWTHDYRPTAVEILGALAGYEYQSCESPDWRDTEAFAFCESLRRATIARLPGYDDVPWSWSDEDIARAIDATRYARR